MNLLNANVVLLFCSLTIASMVVTVHAETTPAASAVASTSWDKQKLKSDLQELEAEVERVRRTQGEGGVHRKGLSQKLAREKTMTEFHLQLIDRLEHIEQRLNAMEVPAGAR